MKNLRKTKKVKNVEEDALGTTLGRVHLKKQDVGSLQTRKMKGLKADRKDRAAKAKKDGKAAAPGDEAKRRKKVAQVFNE